MAIYIAYNKKTMTHFFLRVVKRNDITDVNNVADSELIGLINGLLSAKTHKQLVSAIDAFPATLLFPTEGAKRQPPRTLSPRECVQLLQDDFEPVDPCELAFELYLASPKPLRANDSKNSPAAVFDAFTCGLRDKLIDLDESEYVIFCEPIQDHMTVRNFLSIAAALIANVENPPSGGQVMEASGFYKPKKTAFKDPLFVIPFKYNALTFARNPKKDPVRAIFTLKDNDIDYLCGLYTGSSAPQIESKNPEFIGKANIWFNPIANDPNVFTTLRYNATSKGFTILDLLKASKETDRNLYLCARAQEDQLKTARRVVSALRSATESLRDTNGNPLGMAQDPEGLFGHESSTKFIHFSLISRLFYVLCHHKKGKLIACRYCGCGVICSNRGPQRQWCSNSCRTLDKEAQRHD